MPDSSLTAAERSGEQTRHDPFFQILRLARIILGGQHPGGLVQLLPGPLPPIIQRTDETQHPRLFAGRQVFDFIDNFQGIHAAKLRCQTLFFKRLYRSVLGESCQ